MLDCFVVYTQLYVAAILSTLLAIVQIVVMVGILRQVVGEGLCHPNSMLLLFIVGVFILSGLCHPQEMSNLFHGFMYYLSIPAMYLILIVYSLCNLNVVSWGTREVIQTKAQKEQEELKMMESAARQSDKKGVRAFLNMQTGAASGKVDGAPITCGSLCHCLCCPRPGESPVEKELSSMRQQMTVMQRQLEKSLRAKYIVEEQPRRNPDAYILDEETGESSS